MNRVCVIRHRDYELQLRREAEALRDAGFAVDVIILGESGKPFVSDENGVRCFRLPLSRKRAGRVRYAIDYAAFFVLSALLVTLLDLRHRYSAIQVNSMPDFLAFVTAIPRLRGARIVTFLKEPTPEIGELKYGPGPISRALAAVEQAVIRYSHAVLTVTEQLKERYVERGADVSKITVVLNGHDPMHIGATPRSADRTGFTLLCHGTIEERYGHDDLLDAVALAAEEIPALRVNITGTGSGVENLCRRIDELGLKDVVHYLGFLGLAELDQLIADADIGIVSMRSSAYSNLVHTNKMFDFMAAGTPVLATRLSAVEAYFSDDSMAFAEPDDPASLAQQIVALYRDPERRDRIASRASELYESFGWPAQKRIYVEAYRTLLARRRSSVAYRIAKRALDGVAATAGLVILSPLLMAIAIAIKVDSRGPVFYRGKRLGLNQQPFDVFKFRSMYHDVDDAPHREYVGKLLADGDDASSEDAEMFKLVNDDRVTRVGRVLRRWSLDELPQLINVLRGEMSLVGPRPEVPYALEFYEPWQLQRFDVLPGLTGLWQVSGRANLSPRQMLALDQEYAARCTLALDASILARTIPAVMKRVGSA